MFTSRQAQPCAKFNRVNVQTVINWETGRTQPIKNYMFRVREFLQSSISAKAAYSIFLG